MQNNVVTRILCAVLPLLVIGCSSNAPQQNTANEPSRASNETNEGATSWHCEQGLQTWSCKRRSIADIQQREAQRKNKQYDWSQPDDMASKEARKAATSTATDNAAVVETPTNAWAEDPAKSSDGPAREAVASNRPQTPVSLHDLPGNYWAVQLIALSSQSELKAFMAELNLDELTGAMIEVKGRRYYVALLGVYETRTLAEQAARNRPAALKGLEPYIRSMASLQSAMIRANSL